MSDLVAAIFTPVDEQEVMTLIAQTRERLFSY